MKPDAAVRGYRDFLVASWEAANRVFGSGNSANDRLQADWLQANWELLVETQICAPGAQFLEVYGEGADCNGSSSRVWMPDALPTHRVFCRPISARLVKDEITGRSINPRALTFDGLVHWNGFQYNVSPPFDGVLLSSQTDIFVVSCRDVVFDAEPISPNNPGTFGSGSEPGERKLTE